MRESGLRAIVYCRDYKCSHHVTVDADDYELLRASAQRFVCTACGKRGAHIRPLHEPPMGTSKEER
jgi:hypothetical protein